MGRVTTSFSVQVGLQQGTVLSPFLFTLITESSITCTQDEVQCCGLFTSNEILIGQLMQSNDNLKLWRNMFETNELKLVEKQME